MLKPLAHSLTHMHTFPKTRSNSPNSYLFFRVSAYAWSIKHDHDYAVFILFSAFIAVFLSLALSPLPFSYIDMLWAYGFYLESISGKNVEAPKTNGFTVHFWCVFLFRLIFIFSLSNGYSTATEQQRHRGTSKHKRELTFSRLKRAREMIETISKKFRNLLFLTMRRFPTFLVAIRILFTLANACHWLSFGPQPLPFDCEWKITNSDYVEKSLKFQISSFCDRLHSGLWVFLISIFKSFEVAKNFDKSKHLFIYCWALYLIYVILLKVTEYLQQYWLGDSDIGNGQDL